MSDENIDQEFADLMMEKQLRTYKKILKRRLRLYMDEIQTLERNRARFDSTITKQHIDGKLAEYSVKMNIMNGKLVIIRQLLEMF